MLAKAGLSGSRNLSLATKRIVSFALKSAALNGPVPMGPKFCVVHCGALAPMQSLNCAFCSTARRRRQKAHTETAHGVLENKADFAAPNFAHFGCVKGEQVSATEPDRAGDDLRRRHRQELHERHHGDALARSALADDAEEFSGCEAESDAIDRENLGATKSENRPELTHLQDRRCGFGSCRQFHSAGIPSPIVRELKEYANVNCNFFENFPNYCLSFGKS